MKKTDIERTAHDLHRRIWEARATLWPQGTPSPIEMLDPSVAANVLEIDFEVHEELGGGRFGYRGTRFETAGLIDRQARKIAVSRRFPRETVRFTGAHEIGHWILHPGQVMHRDRPVKQLASDAANRPPEEVEADYFAACFLMPRKLLTNTFESTFCLHAPLVINDDVAFRLCPNDPDSVLRADDDSLERALAVASATTYGNRFFNSLAKQFGVSVGSMAIRLSELELVE